MYTAFNTFYHDFVTNPLVISNYILPIEFFVDMYYSIFIYNTLYCLLFLLLFLCKFLFYHQNKYLLIKKLELTTRLSVNFYSQILLAIPEVPKQSHGPLAMFFEFR